jgi:hypothetical protein
VVYAVVGEVGAGATLERWLVEVFACRAAAERHRIAVQERADRVNVEIRYLIEAILSAQDDEQL